MRLQQIINEDFSWDSDWDKEMYISLKGLANKNNGVWKSKKQRNFLMKRIKDSNADLNRTPQQAKEFFGVDMTSDQELVLPSGMTRWADYGSRSLVPVRHAFVVDNIGVVSHVKLGNKGNMRDGSAPDPSKNKVEFTRPANVDASHLEKTEDEKKKEFKTALGMGEGEYVGEQGKRMDFGTVELVAKKEIGYSTFGYNQGVPKYWNLYRNEDGNLIQHVGKEGPERGDKIKIVATVKDHFISKKGDKTTKIIRPRFYEVETNEEIKESKKLRIQTEKFYKLRDDKSLGDYRNDIIYTSPVGYRHKGEPDEQIHVVFGSNSEFTDYIDTEMFVGSTLVSNETTDKLYKNWNLDKRIFGLQEDTI